MPKEEDPFLFSFKADEYGAIYLSRNPLSGDPDKDKYFLILKRDRETASQNKELSVKIVTSTKFCLIILIQQNSESTGIQKTKR